MQNITKLVMIVIILIIANISQAYASWMVNIRVTILDAENRIIAGQKADADDLVDGRFDVLAMINGDIAAYFKLAGDKYWKDIKAICDDPDESCIKDWDIVVESEQVGEEITLKWDFVDLPEDMEITLVDLTKDEAINMVVVGEYKYINSGNREFKIKVK